MKKTRMVFICNILGNATDGQVSEFITENTIGMDKMQMGKWKGKSKGYVFVQYDSFERAADVLS